MRACEHTPSRARALKEQEATRGQARQAILSVTGSDFVTKYTQYSTYSLALAQELPELSPLVHDVLRAKELGHEETRELILHVG